MDERAHEWENCWCSPTVEHVAAGIAASNSEDYIQARSALWGRRFSNDEANSLISEINLRRAK